MSTDGTPPALALLQQALGFWLSRAICVVAQLGIADLLKNGPLDTEKLAAAARVHAPSLYRVLRTLARVGIFAEREDGRFGLTPKAEPLRSDAPDSIRDYILLVGEEWYSGPSDHLLHSVQTGRPAVEQVHGADFFTFLARDPAAAAVFDAVMTSRSAQENDAIAAACDFSGIVRLGGFHDREFEVLESLIVIGDEAQVDRNGCLHGRLLKAFGHSCAVGCAGQLLPDLGAVVLAMSIVHMRQEFSACAHQMRTTPQEVPGGAPLGRLDSGLGEYAAA